MQDGNEADAPGEKKRGRRGHAGRGGRGVRRPRGGSHVGGERMRGPWKVMGMQNYETR